MTPSRMVATAEIAPTNTPGDLLGVCGAVGLGWLLSEGHQEVLSILRGCAKVWHMICGARGRFESGAKPTAAWKSRRRRYKE